MEMINALGRRKSAVARIYLTEGNGKITINKRDLTEYFPSSILQFVVKQPLNLLEVCTLGPFRFDSRVNLSKHFGKVTTMCTLTCAMYRATLLMPEHHYYLATAMSASILH